MLTLFSIALVAFGSDVCAGVGPPEQRLSYPDHWPTYLGRCLDVGPGEETLLERARRCALEEPEDPAPVRVLSYLGGPSDIPWIEAAALDGPNREEAVLALLRMEH